MAAPATAPKRRRPSVPAGSLRLVWNPKQSRFLKSLTRYLNLEGGVRAGKSFALCFKILFLALKYPGINCALTRWTQDGLDAQLRPIWRAVCRLAGVRLVWHADEEYDEIVGTGGSIVYLRALKSSEETQRYSKLAGLTLAVLGIDQAEEVPEDVYRHYVPARLSQVGYPHQVIITPNPPTENSWIATDWPVTGAAADHEYIHTTLYDNRAILGEDYVREIEAAYKPGSFEFRRLVQGLRGLMVAGTPIFGRQFIDSRHVPTPAPEYVPHVELCEAWDFGTLHPCVVWCQFLPAGRLAVLGGVMGIDLHLEQFAPLVAEVRAEWFPGVTLLQQTCDPAGATSNAHGTETGLSLLQAFGVYPVVREQANHPPVKAAAVEVVIGYLSRSLPDGTPCFALNPRFLVVSADGRTANPVLQNALSAGYVYDAKRSYIGTAYPHLRPPKKDGWYEHPADAFLYNVTAFAPADGAAQAGLVRHARAERDARKALARIGRTLASPAEVVLTQAAILQARAAHEDRQAQSKALRAAQKDPDEKFRWSRVRTAGGVGRRAGY